MGGFDVKMDHARPIIAMKMLGLVLFLTLCWTSLSTLASIPLHALSMICGRKCTLYYFIQALTRIFSRPLTHKTRCMQKQNCLFMFMCKFSSHDFQAIRANDPPLASKAPSSRTLVSCWTCIS
jgi:hypothetical protein